MPKVLANIGSGNAVPVGTMHGSKVGTQEEYLGFRPVLGTDSDEDWYAAEREAEEALKAERAHLPDPPKPKCSATTKGGEPCKGYATATGLCAGHTNAAKAG